MQFLPKTLPVVIACLLVIYGLLVYPIWNFWYIERSLWLRLASLFFLAACLCVFGFIVLPEDKQEAPKLDIKLYVKPGIDQYPLQNYSLIVQNMNRKSVPITDLRIEFMFKNIVSEVKTHSISLDSAGTAFVYETKNGKSALIYEDQTEETALTKHFSLNIQKATIKGKTINTNLVWFDCDVWPDKMFSGGDIIVDLSKIPEIHKRPEKEGTYYGTYSYTANGQKVSKTITGIIPDALSSQANPKEGSLLYHLKMAIDSCIMNKFKCLIVNCHHQ